MYSFHSPHMQVWLHICMRKSIPSILLWKGEGVWEAHYPSAQVSNPCHLNETHHQQSTALLNLNLPALPLTSNILWRRT